jgi:hypothetical protein
VTTRFKVVFLIGVLLICMIIPTIAAELTYKEYARESEAWRRGFLLGIAQYLSAVAQPDEEPPYHPVASPPAATIRPQAYQWASRTRITRMAQSSLIDRAPLRRDFGATNRCRTCGAARDSKND